MVQLTWEDQLLGLVYAWTHEGLLSIFNFLKKACGLGMHNFFKQLEGWDKENFEFEDRLGEAKQKGNSLGTRYDHHY